MDLKHGMLLASSCRLSVPDALWNEGGYNSKTPSTAMSKRSNNQSLLMFEQVGEKHSQGLSSMKSMYATAESYYGELARLATKKGKVQDLQDELDTPSVSHYNQRILQILETKESLLQNQMMPEKARRALLYLAEQEYDTFLNRVTQQASKKPRIPEKVTGPQEVESAMTDTDENEDGNDDDYDVDDDDDDDDDDEDSKNKKPKAKISRN